MSALATLIGLISLVNLWLQVKTHTTLSLPCMITYNRPLFNYR